MICACPNPTIIKVRSSENAAALQWTQVVVVICPCLFRVPLMLRAWRSSIGQEGSKSCWMRVGSMKFPVAPQPTRVVVTTVLALYIR